MSLPFLTLFISAFLVAEPVFAGSRAWESSIVYAQPSYPELHGGLFEPENGNSTIGVNSTKPAPELKKRYVTINPGTGNADDRLWPKGKIQYCFESSATKELFFEDLHEARELWANAGLGSGFDWVEKDSSFCKDNANRPNFLLIVKSDGLSCTTGIPPLKKMSGDPENRGPLMRLTTDLDMGKENLVANFAHQMGHAWGLFHEHQNPAWWSSDYAAADGDIFSSSNFKCEKLADYASVSERLTAEQMKKACTSRAYAKTYRFSAAEYLPITDSTAYRASSTATEPDWDSIMIYDSKMGSALTKPNGDAITPVLSPSQRDVDGLKTLYGISSSVKFNPLGSKSHPKLETFKDIRKKDKDSGCKEAEDDDEDDVPTTTTSPSSAPSATATADCRAIGEQILSEIPDDPDEEDEPVQKRQMHHALHNRNLEKRGKKKGWACAGLAGVGWNLESFGYPEYGKNKGADVYGWSTPLSCENYQWGGALDHTASSYQSEHVLEWSVVTNFFTIMNSKYAKDEFENADPNEDGKMNFCEHWKQTWDLKGQQFMDNPAPQSGMSPAVTRRKPVKWLAAAYPYETALEGGPMFLDELPLLQQMINSPAKNNMFSNNDIYVDDKMNKLILRTKPNTPPENAPRIAIQNLRAVVGVFKYMQEPKIEAIFKKEKIRMGAVIDGIDTELPNYPIQIVGGSKPRTFAPWTPLGLGAKWDTYMDETFETAKKKATDLMKVNLDRLHEEYTSVDAKNKAKDDTSLSPSKRQEIAEWARLRSDIEGYILKLEAEWEAVKDWKKPW